MNVVTITYRSTSYYLLESGEGEQLLVDCGWPDTIGILEHELGRKGIAPDGIGYILVTHYHPDHAGLVEEMKRHGATLILLDVQLPHVAKLTGYVKPTDGFIPIRTDDALTTSVSDSRSVLARLGFEGQIVHTPGHSPDSVSLLLDSGEAFIGDLQPEAQSAPEDSATWGSWKRLRELGARRIYPAHGGDWMLEGIRGAALVLGGGGVTGIAWELGVIAGLSELGVELRTADLLVGTSAGAAVGAQIAAGAPIEELYAVQLSGPGREIPPPSGSNIGFMLRLAVMMFRSRAGAQHGEAALRQFAQRAGAYAKKTHTIAPAQRREVIESRLPSRRWPAQRLLITAVDADTGELRVFDRDSGVELVDAVAASCAVPGVWPPVRIDGRLFIDGGTRSPANVDLANRCDRVVVLAPILRSGLPGSSVAEQVASLGRATRSAVVSPDKQAAQAFGRNPLDPRVRGVAARAGHEQAARVADRIAAVWES